MKNHNLLTIAEAARRLKISVAKMRILANQHKFLCVGFGNKSIRILEERLNVFLVKNTGKQVLEPLPPKPKTAKPAGIAVIKA